MTPDDATPGLRLAAAGGIAGPVIFTAAWGVLGATRTGYSAVGDAISQLAAVGTSTRAPMTAALVAFGLGVPAYGLALRRWATPGAGLAAAVAGAATLGVAALPLEAGTGAAAHAAAAGLAYTATAAIPLLAAPALARYGRPWTLASQAVGAGTAVLLAASAVLPASGLLQRMGLALTHAWIVASAAAIVRGPGTGQAGVSPPPRRPASGRGRPSPPGRP